MVLHEFASFCIRVKSTFAQTKYNYEKNSIIIAYAFSFGINGSNGNWKPVGKSNERVER